MTTFNLPWEQLNRQEINATKVLREAFEERWYRIHQDFPQLHAPSYLLEAKELLEYMLSKQHKAVKDQELRELSVAIDYFFSQVQRDESSYGTGFISTRLYAHFRRELLAKELFTPDEEGKQLLKDYIEIEVLSIEM